MLADKVLGKAEKLGLIDASDTPAILTADELAFGKLLLAIVSSALAAGLETERALREATRELQFEIRSFELDSDSDAGVLAPYRFTSARNLKADWENSNLERLGYFVRIEFEL